MVIMAAANVIGLVLFALSYALAAARLVAPGASQALLLLLVVLVTALWVRVEGRHVGLGFVRRVGRATAGLLIAAFGASLLALMPLFALDARVPEEAGLRPVVAAAMAVLLASLAMLVVVNLLGAGVAVALSLSRRPRRLAGDR